MPRDLELRKRTTKKDLKLFVFNQIKSGKRPSTISKEFNIPLNTIQYYIDFLKNNQFIRKKGYGTWEILKNYESFSIGVKTPVTDLHAFNIKFPILSGEIKGSDWEVRNQLRNWLPKYKKLDIFRGMTIRNNNNKSISVFLYPREIELHKDPYIIEKLAFKIKSYLFEYFKTKYNVILDVMEAETKNIHLETQDEKLQGILRKGEVFEVDLGKKAQKLFPKDNM